MRSLVVATALWVFTCTVVPPAGATPPGTLDPSFGLGGRARGFDTGRWLSPESVAQQADGKLVVIAQELLGPSFGALLRYDVDGTLDPSFGAGGVVDGPHGYGSIAVQPDGRILAATYTLLARYATSGAPDVTFGGDGQVDLGFQVATASALVVRPDGRIVVGGSTDLGVVLAQLLSDGTPDATFGTAGVVTIDPGLPPGEDYFQPERILLQPDGKIVATGGGPTGWLLRCLADGSLDPSFGTGGVVTPLEGGDDVALQADGKLVTAARHVLARYDANGALDASFGSGGTVPIEFLFQNQASLAVQPDGKILLGAWSPSRLLRYLPDGSPDASFGPGGWVSDAYSATQGILVQDDGRIVLLAFTADHGIARVIGGTCGDGVVEGGEECDGGSGCDPNCCLTDTDGDGVCDVHDPCTSPGPTALRVTYSGLSGTKSRFRLAGQFEVPASFVPSLDPVTNGVRLILRDGTYTFRDVTLPGGVFAIPPNSGWVPPRGVPPSRWVYNKTDYFSMRIVTVRSAPGRVKVSAKARYIGRPEVPASLTAGIVLAVPTATGGECGEARLTCTPNAGGTTVKCR